MAIKRSTETDVKVAENLRALRLTSGMSQNELAAKAGMKQQTINKLENASVRITAGAMHKLAQALGQPYAAFFKGTEKE